MEKYCIPAQIRNMQELKRLQRFAPFETLPEKLILLFCGFGMLLLLVIMGK
jgi:hypothetical protein